LLQGKFRKILPGFNDLHDGRRIGEDQTDLPSSITFSDAKVPCFGGSVLSTSSLMTD
jgi:hypothetical protein